MTRLASWLLNLVYLAALVVCAPFLLWAAISNGKYRDGYAQKLLGRVPRRDGNAICVWLHAVSVGEVNLVATLLGQLRAENPDWQFVISTTSRAGFELARKKYADLSVFYCPLDFSWAVRTAMQRVRPTLLVLAELELWPNLIAAAKEQGARVAIINGRMSDKSFPGYRRVRPLMARVLARLDLIAVQNEESAARFIALGAPASRVNVTGSLKYDGAETDRNNPRTLALRKLANIVDDDIVFLAGSTQEPEEQIAIEIYRKLSARHPRLRLILVPRHPERFEAVAKLLTASGLPWVRRSRLDSLSRTAATVNSQGRKPLENDGRGQEAPQGRQSLSAPVGLTASANHLQGLTPLAIDGRPVGAFGALARPILLVDTVGELGAWWGTASIAFVGGSFGSRGGQNMIEPAAYGAAVSFGPNTWNFRDIVAALVSDDAAVVVRDGGELEAFVQRCLDEPHFAAEIGDRARRLVQSQLGATERTRSLVKSLLSPAGRAISTTRSAA